MNGYRVVFSTIKSRRVGSENILEWFIKALKSLNIEGMTVINALEGYGRDSKIHSAGFFELAEQPIEIIIHVSENECEKLFEILKNSSVNIFYSKTKAEFGII